MESLCQSYEVVIVGAGPSGLSVALNLLRRGVTDILVVERSRFPRYKCCAGYITAKTKKAYRELGLDLDGCHYSLIKDFNIFYRFKPQLNVENKFLYTNRLIDRVELDDAFYRLAVSKGVTVRENTHILAHDPQENNVTLSDGTVVQYRYFVFADGTSGYGSRYQRAGRKNIAMQLTFPSDLPEQIGIHFGVTKRGYAWVSSFGGVTNVGITDVYDRNVDYREVFQNFLKDNHIAADMAQLRGAFTPIGIKKPVLFRNVYFVGDAVGACDPLTLSGLRYGLASGEQCAKAIAEGKSGVYKRAASLLKFRFGLIADLAQTFLFKARIMAGFQRGLPLFRKARFPRFQ